MIRLAALVLFLLTGCAAQIHAQVPLFTPGSPVVVGPGSGEVVLADLNRDGHLDLLTKHLLNQTIVTQLGDGQGHFTPAANSSLRFGYQPGAITLGHINNDAMLDLGVASRDGDGEYLHIFLGNSGGSFNLVPGSPFTVTTAIEVYKPALHIIDLNEDGRPDIVTANGRRNTIEILFGDGRGGLARGPRTRLEPAQNRYFFALGDVDRDGHLDLVTLSTPQAASSPGRLAIKRGDGTGAFTTLGSPLSLPPAPRLGALADLNGDRHLDIVLSHAPHHLSILLNDGQGAFTPSPASPYNLGLEAFAIVAADLNQDQQTDLAAATVDSVTVLLGDGHTFTPAPGSPFPAGPGAYNLALGDLNEDGKLDIAVSSFEGSAVTILLAQ